MLVYKVKSDIFAVNSPSSLTCPCSSGGWQPTMAEGMSDADEEIVMLQKSSGFVGDPIYNFNIKRSTYKHETTFD